MPVAVNINNQNIKMVAAARNKITRWETVELPPGLVKDGQILNPEKTAELLKGLFEKDQMTGDEVTACVTGMSFVYRLLALPKLKSPEMREAIERATQKEINVPLEELYFDWQVVAEKADSVEIFVLGAPRVMVDALAQTFKLANLKLSAVDLNSLALARLVNQDKALIADFGRDWFDIVIVAGGLPVTLHSVAPKGNLRELEDTVSQMNEEIRRTVDFFNLSHKDSSIKTDETVFLSGISKSNAGAGLLIDRYLPNAIGSANGQLSYPEAFVPADYAILLGLVLKTREVRTTSKSAHLVYKDINLNLLNGRKRVMHNPLSFKKILVPAAIIAAVILLTPLLLARNSGQSESRSLQTRLDEVNRDLNLRRMILSQSDITETQISKYLSDLKLIRNERDSISGPGNLAESLDITIAGFSERISYNDIVSTANQIVVQGQAESRLDVLKFSSYLESQKRFLEVRIGSIEDINAEAVNDGSNSGPVSYRIILERQ